MSGIGKGVIAASIGKIMQVRGLRVTAVKVDPYLNYDAGTMNPYIHGEVFVTEDGGETDMDIGTYERFTRSTTLQLVRCILQLSSASVAAISSENASRLSPT